MNCLNCGKKLEKGAIKLISLVCNKQCEQELRIKIAKKIQEESEAVINKQNI